MDSLLTIISGLVVALLGWFALNFLGKPYLKFRDLCKEVNARMMEYANVRARWSELPDDPSRLVQHDLTESDKRRLDEAQSAFRKLGSEMRAFVESERITVWILNKRGYSPREASAGLIGLSNSMERYGRDRHHFTKMTQTALRIPEA